jgi:hypothetical protein
MTRSYQVTRTIAAPARTVWNLLTDSSSYTEWNRAVVRISGEIREGNSIELVSIASPKRAFKLRITEMAAPSKMVWSDSMPLGLFTGTRTFTLSELADGRCDFTMVEEFGGPLAGLITKAIPDLTDSFDLFADGLRAAAEAASGT